MNNVTLFFIALCTLPGLMHASDLNPKGRGDHRYGLKIKEAIKQKKQEQRTQREYLKQVKIKTIRIKPKA